MDFQQPLFYVRYQKSNYVTKESKENVIPLSYNGSYS